MTNITLSPKIIYKKLSEKVEGQHEAKKSLSLALYMHYTKIFQVFYNQEEYGQKSNLLFVGPTGCGKTHLINSAKGILPHIPVIEVDATHLTKTGYIGNSLEDILESSLSEYGYMSEYAIVFIDEIDKLCVPFRSADSSDYNKEIQHNILKMIEGAEIHIKDEYKNKTKAKKLNTKNMLFILGGNFQKIRKAYKESQAKGGIGFKRTTNNVKITNLHVELIEVGLVQELAGRISSMVELMELNKTALRKIFYNPKVGVYAEYKKLLKVVHLDLELSPYYVNKIIDRCVENKTGARGLNTAMDEILSEKIFNNVEICFPIIK